MNTWLCSLCSWPPGHLSAHTGHSSGWFLYSRPESLQAWLGSTETSRLFYHFFLKPGIFLSSLPQELTIAPLVVPTTDNWLLSLDQFISFIALRIIHNHIHINTVCKIYSRYKVYSHMCISNIHIHKTPICVRVHRCACVLCLHFLFLSPDFLHNDLLHHLTPKSSTEPGTSWVVRNTYCVNNMWMNEWSCESKEPFPVLVTFILVSTVKGWRKKSKHRKRRESVCFSLL